MCVRMWCYCTHAGWTECVCWYNCRSMYFNAIQCDWTFCFYWGCSVDQRSSIWCTSTSIVVRCCRLYATKIHTLHKCAFHHKVYKQTQSLYCYLFSLCFHCASVKKIHSIVHNSIINLFIVWKYINYFRCFVILDLTRLIHIVSRKVNDRICIVFCLICKSHCDSTD